MLPPIFKCANKVSDVINRCRKFRDIVSNEIRCQLYAFEIFKNFHARRTLWPIKLISRARGLLAASLLIAFDRIAIFVKMCRNVEATAYRGPVPRTRRPQRILIQNANTSSGRIPPELTSTNFRSYSAYVHFRVAVAKAPTEFSIFFNVRNYTFLDGSEISAPTTRNAAENFRGT